MKRFKDFIKYNLLELNKYSISWESNATDDIYYISDTELKIKFKFNNDIEFDEELIDPVSGKKYKSNYDIFLDDLKDLSTGHNENLEDLIKIELEENNIDFVFDFSKGFLKDTTIIFKIDYDLTLKKLINKDPEKIYKLRWPENILPKDKKERENLINSMKGLKKYNL